MTRGRAVNAIAVLVLVAAGIFGAIAYFNARDSSTVSRSAGPGRVRPAGERPAVRSGNILLLYSDEKDVPQLRAIQDELSGTDKALAAAGQAVLVRRGAAPQGIAALSARHRIDASRADDNVVSGFAEYWLGRKDG
ncbi:MAG: hypothetical protein QOG15_3037 [Solirubrobacteraceae bacterium]|nr:hypothetical protein [Solirubrobacteraceae bacterium]